MEPGKDYRNEPSRKRVQLTQKHRGGTTQTVDRKCETRAQCGGRSPGMEGGQEAGQEGWGPKARIEAYLVSIGATQGF